MRKSVQESLSNDIRIQDLESLSKSDNIAGIE
jgi:hypothetical protein